MAEVEKMVSIATHASDCPEKAAMPFVMANAALSMDVEATVVLQGAGVFLALKGFADKLVHAGGFPPLKKLIDDFLELGGELKVCGPCIKERAMDESDLIEGSTTIAGAEVVIKTLEANAVLTY